MSDTEKIEKLQNILKSIIDWYKATEVEGEPDSSYLYDVTVEQFENNLSRGDYQQIIEILK